MSTSELQHQVSTLLEIHLGQFSKRENHRPEWILDETGRRLELDFFIPDLKIAIEVQGVQHYVYTPHFHKDVQEFEDMKLRDELKRAACERLGITLFDISTPDDAIDMIAGIKLMLGMTKPYNNPDPRLIKALADLMNAGTLKGIRGEKKLALWRERQGALLDYISGNPALLTEIDPQIGKWIMSKLHKVEDAIKSFEIELERKLWIKQKFGSQKEFHRFDQWRQEQLSTTGKSVTPEDYHTFVVRERRKRHHRVQHKTNIDVGYITLFSIDGLYRVLFTTKDPQNQAVRLNKYRTEHVLMWSKYCGSELRAQHESVITTLRSYAFIDDTHRDYWFKFSDDDLARLFPGIQNVVSQEIK